MSDENKSTPAPASSAPQASSESNDNEVLETSSDDSGQELEGDHSSESEIDADPTLSKTEKKEAKKKLKQLEIKFNGKTSKEDLPFEIDEEHADWMRRQLQMAKMGQTKSQEAANWERDTMAFLHELKTNPRKVLSNPHLGVDLRKIAGEILEEELANSQKTPEQLKQEEYERELKELRDEKLKREEEYKRLERDKAVEQAAQQYDISMSKALDEYNIPKTPMAIKKMAEYMSIEIQRGYEPDMEIIAKKVEEEMVTDYKEMLLSLPHEKRLALLGEELFEQDRKARVSKIKKAPQNPKQVKDIAKKEEKKEEPKQKTSYKDFFGI